MTKDQIELLRPGFEAAIIERFKESGFLEVEIRVECLTRCGDSYDEPQVAIAWWAWCLSREEIVVSPFKLITLPPSLVNHPSVPALESELERVGVKVKS